MKILLGKPQSQRSVWMQKEALRKAKENPFAKIWYIVPEQYTLQMQRELIEQNNQQGLLNLEVLSFNRLVYRLQNQLQTAGKMPLKPSGKATLIYRILEENPERFPILSKKRNSHAYIRNLAAMMTECYQYRMDGEKLKTIAERLTGELVRDKTRDLAELVEAYQQAIRADYFMVEALLEEVCAVLQQAKELAEIEVFVDGFYSFVPIQIDILKIFSEKAKQLYLGLPFAWSNPKNLGLEDMRYPSELYYDIKNTVAKLREHQGMGNEEIILFPRKMPNISEEIHILEDALFQKAQEAEKEERLQIHLAEAGSMEEEIRFVAEQMLDFIYDKGYRFRDMAVLVGNLPAYRPKIKRIFEEYRLSYFVDGKETIADHPLMLFVTSALQTVSYRFRYEDVFAHLKNIYIYGRWFGTEKQAELEKEISRLDIYAIEHGIRGAKAYQKLENISEELQEVIVDLAEFAGDINTAKSFHQKLEALQRYLEKKQISIILQKQLEKWAEEEKWLMISGYRQVWEKIGEYFNEMATFMKMELLQAESQTNSDNLCISTEDFSAMLTTGLQELEFASTPPVPDQVIVGSLEHSRIHKVKILFAIGLGESSVPSVQSDSGFFSDWERQLIKPLAGKDYGIAEDRKTSIYKAQLAIYMAVMSATESLYFSYSRVDGGGKMERPSNLFYQIRRIFAANPVRNLTTWWQEHERVTYPEPTLISFRKQFLDGGKNPNFLRVYESLLRSEKRAQMEQLQLPMFTPKEHIGRDLAGKLYHPDRKMSISRLESFGACPFLHFVRYGLRAREIVPYQAERVDMGIFLHKALETAFVLSKERNKQLFELTPEEYQEILQEAIQAGLANDKRQIFLGTARNRFLAERLSEIADRALRTSQRQLASGKMSFFKEEVYFRKENMAGIQFFTEQGEEFYLEGVIDRIDVQQEGEWVYFSILDYKTGQHDLDYTEIYYGLQLQLLIYLEAGQKYLQSGGQIAKPVSAAYFHMKNPIFSQSALPQEEDFLKEMRLRGVFVAEEMTRLDAGIAETGSSQVMNIRLKKDGTPYANAMVLSGEELKKMEQFAHHKAEQLATQIWQGDTAVRPYAYNNRLPCTYCKYAGICGVDKKVRPYRYLTAKTKEDITQSLNETAHKGKKKE